MKEACRFYSFLISIKQHEALKKLSREKDVALVTLIREAIGLFLQNGGE